MVRLLLGAVDGKLASPSRPSENEVPLIAVVSKLGGKPVPPRAETFAGWAPEALSLPASGLPRNSRAVGPSLIVAMATNEPPALLLTEPPFGDEGFEPGRTNSA